MSEAHDTKLTAGERERYRANHAYFRAADPRPAGDPWDSQLLLKHARVTVLGVGGAGSHAAWSLAAAGVGSVHLVDPGRVEEPHLAWQSLYTEADLGRPKAEVAARRLTAVNSMGRHTYEARRADTEEALTALVRDCDVFALCTDGMDGMDGMDGAGGTGGADGADGTDGDRIREAASRVCVTLGVPWVCAGTDGLLATVGVYAPEGPCFECVAAGEGERPEPGRKPSPAPAPVAGVCGQLVAHEVVSLLTGIATTPPGYVRGLHLNAPDQHVFVRHPARPDCRSCHPQAGCPADQAPT
ncbi:ThiF family adenylyltransferase [Streptomyces sp. NBC_01275]|uniref:HesA/MoeB/ThiF family protein n=1 Tax=Streptomyces sp. NBC_01275 TaxID=2903807 RepID=UPI00225B8697|nr:ThiF family adenylyltransferase [Streptomyces sp. NBC_01275]MCX4764754.1 ThiF family adenylyltransferase [Streptomyces sp. NBC_01275]